MDLAEWQDTPVEEVSLEVMDAMIKEYAELRDAHEAAKKAASDVYKTLEEVQNKVLSVLEKAGKKSYKVDGIGTFSVVVKQTVKIPEDLEKKRLLLEYIKDTYGADVFDSMVSIHHATLNSFYNSELERRDNDPLFSLPGVDAPVARKEPRFTRAK